MASGLSFFSSPPHPTSNSWERSSTTATPFYTPQQPSRQSHWGFAPTSPSPLRTSRNANLMPAGSAFGFGGEKPMGVDGEAENVVSRQDGVLEESSEVITPSMSGVVANPPVFSFGDFTTGKVATAQDRATQFQFEARARSSSPSALLQSHAREGRDSRKKLFLNRLKSKRDDARVDRAGDQVLRMDFMRERKQWIAEKEKVEWDAGDVDEMADLHDEMDEMSPTEEKEVEELAREYYLQQQMEGSCESERVVDAAFEEFSDDGYDEAFMEVLSQGPEAQSQDWENMGNVGVSEVFNTPSQQQMGGVDSEMDMS